PAVRPDPTSQAPAQSSAARAPAPPATSPQASNSQASSSRASGSLASSSLATGPSRTQPQPTLGRELAFMVVNVQRDDVLNVRNGPSADFEVVGGLPPGSRGVKVTGACQSQWCPVEHTSARGWVNSIYLAREEPTSPVAPPGARGDGPHDRALVLRDAPDAPR